MRGEVMRAPALNGTEGFGITSMLVWPGLIA